MSLMSYGRRIRAKIEPQLHLRVPFEAGIYANSPRWSNKDLDPIAPERKTWGGIDYWAYWCSDMLAPPLAATVSSVMSLGFTARETIPIVFFGFAICSVVVTLTGKMGATYSIPFPVIVRSIFGMYGSLPAICIRAFVALMWTAILTVQAGAFLQRCIEALWPEFIDFPNSLPLSANITSAELLCVFLYWIVQTALSLMPIEKLRLLFLVKAVVVPPTFLILFLWAAIVTKGGGPLVTGTMALQSPYLGPAYSALTGLNVIIGLFSSMAVNMPDFGRFSKNRLAGGHQFLALPIIGTLGALTPIFVTSANQYLHGSFEWYMPAVIANFDNRAAKFFTALSFILATIGNQVAAGSYPFSNDVTGLWPKYINIFRATLFISLFCIISTPWNIIRNAAGLLAFLSGYSCLMGPLAGVMVTDYYIIKKGKLNIHAMYTDGPESLYWYTGGFNLRAFAAFIIGVGPLLPGFAKSIEANLDVGEAWKLYAFAWIFGFVVASTTYYAINTWVWPQTVSLIDEAVLPPQKGEEAPSPVHGQEESVEGVAVDGKKAEQVQSSEKESGSMV